MKEVFLVTLGAGAPCDIGRTNALEVCILREESVTLLDHWVNLDLNRTRVSVELDALCAEVKLAFLTDIAAESCLVGQKIGPSCGGNTERELTGCTTTCKNCNSIHHLSECESCATCIVGVTLPETVAGCADTVDACCGVWNHLEHTIEPVCVSKVRDDDVICCDSVEVSSSTCDCNFTSRLVYCANNNSSGGVTKRATWSRVNINCCTLKLRPNAWSEGSLCDCDCCRRYSTKSTCRDDTNVGTTVKKVQLTVECERVLDVIDGDVECRTKCLLAGLCTKENTVCNLLTHVCKVSLYANACGLTGANSVEGVNGSC